MIFPIYAIRDELTTWLTPMVDTNDQSAIRNFRLALSSPRSIMEKNPTDFCLYRIGEYDNETGKIKSLEVPEFVIRGESEVINND